jgi:hypothetical protein
MNGTLIVASQEQITTLMTNYKEFVSLAFLDKDNDRALTVAYKDENGDLQFMTVGGILPNLGGYVKLVAPVSGLPPAPGFTDTYFLPTTTSQDIGKAWVAESDCFIFKGDLTGDIELKKGDILVCISNNDIGSWIGGGSNFTIIQSNIFLNGIELKSDKIKFKKILNASSVPIYDDNESAQTGGLVEGDFYRTSTGELMIVY